MPLQQLTAYLILRPSGQGAELAPPLLAVMSVIFKNATKMSRPELASDMGGYNPLYTWPFWRLDTPTPAHAILLTDDNDIKHCAE